ncbi:MAG: DUF4139 domain-containing protein [Myxococcota bacterium]|nr:DUF4139 domain-containing protein [Myxococcota bacterium]
MRSWKGAQWGGFDSHARAASALGLLSALLGLGCGRQAIVTIDGLPVRRVVVYRNGVAYFERAGHVERDEVRFKMKQTEVGDFLATLAVMERGGSSVRAAAFPLKTGDDDEGTKPPREKTYDEKNGLQTVLLSLDGKAHDLQVGYIAESPVWRPSYRLVIHASGDADLQAWGIVQNLSGEDWKDVKLTLIAGAPLSFQAELGTPVIPLRPTVTDEGEVIAAVPHGETSLKQQEATPMVPAPAKPLAASDSEPLAHSAGADMKASTAAAPPPSPAAAAAPRYPTASGTLSMAPSPPRNLRSLAAIAIEGGTTRYDLPLPVTIPDKSATMVLLLSRPVPGEALFMFAPDAGVPDSSSHPFRVARFVNGAGGVLERGPIAVFEDGAFLGQGMLDPLPAGATATVPFALDRAIAVDQNRKFDELGARVAKIETAELTVERDAVTQTKYRARNGSDTLAKLLVKHLRIGGARLFEPPSGTEDNVGTGAALVPAKIAPHATVELVVDERVTVRRPADWFSPIADNAIKAYLADPKADQDVTQRLTAAWLVRNDIVSKRVERTKLQQEHQTLSQSTEETRRNLHAIEKNKSAEVLRQKLTARLADAATKLDDLNRRIVELDSKLAELGVQFKEALRDIGVLAP